MPKKKPAIFKIISNKNTKKSNDDNDNIAIKKIFDNDDKLDLGCTNKQIVAGVTIIGMLWIFSWISSFF